MRIEGPLERFCGAGEWTEVLRTMVVAAHPDDETIGAGARIARLGSACTVVHVTDGAPSDRRFFAKTVSTLSRAAYARVRREEALHALGTGGLEASRVVSLGLRDQESSFDMASVAERLSSLMSELRPEVVVTHAYEGGHPDHDTTALAVHAAAALIPAPLAPPLIEMTSYHDQGGATVRGEFLPTPGLREMATALNDEDRRRKRAMLAAYTTQREILGPFRTETERFRLAPRYVFGKAPHEGRLHYERFAFNVSGPMWRALARTALRKLGLDEGPI
jgi:LmbE family N-acetylglucosaminyl deacetylase